MTDLFDFGRIETTEPPRYRSPPYPAQPGYKDRDTSREAAEAIKPDAARLRAMCLRELRAVCAYGGTATADQIASRLDLSVLSVRPRFSELLRGGLIEDAGERRVNASGRSAKTWGRGEPEPLQRRHAATQRAARFS